MQVLASADLHGKHDVYRWLVDTARVRKPDVIILAGDLLGHSDAYESVDAVQEADRVILISELSMLEQHVFYIMGNDDWIELRSTQNRHVLIHANRYELGRWNIVGYQYTLPFMKGINEKTEAEIAQDLAALDPLLDDRTILVTHGPAYGILDRGIRGRHTGSPSLAEYVKKRQVFAHIHGHIHNEFGRFTNHFNVASAGQKRAMLIDLHTLSNEVLTD